MFKIMIEIPWAMQKHITILKWSRGSPLMQQESLVLLVNQTCWSSRPSPVHDYHSRSTPPHHSSKQKSPETGLFSVLTCEILLCTVFTRASRNHCLSPGKVDRWPSTLWEKQRLGWQSEQPGRHMFYSPSLCKTAPKVNPRCLSLVLF